MTNFWKNKKVLITGASGFVGSNLTIKLLEQGARVYALYNKKISHPSFLDTKQTHSKLTVIIQDILQSDIIDSLFKREAFSYCYHFAAQSLVEKASTNPVTTFEINIKGTLNILEAVRKHKIEGLVIASTTHVYGKNRLPFLEKYTPKPTGPYETSKVCADIIAQTYATHYNIPIAIARSVNIYGPYDFNNRLVPATIVTLLENKKPVIFSDKTTRDYIFIDDVIDAYILLAKKIRDLGKNNTNIIFNLGTGAHFDNSTIVKKIVNLFGNPDIKPRLISHRRKQEIRTQYVSIEKAKKYLAWEPKHSIDEGLKKTITWYKSTYPL